MYIMYYIVYFERIFDSEKYSASNSSISFVYYSIHVFLFLPPYINFLRCFLATAIYFLSFIRYDVISFFSDCLKEPVPYSSKIIYDLFCKQGDSFLFSTSLQRILCIIMNLFRVGIKMFNSFNKLVCIILWITCIWLIGFFIFLFAPM